MVRGVEAVPCRMGCQQGTEGSGTSCRPTATSSSGAKGRGAAPGAPEGATCLIGPCAARCKTADCPSGSDSSSRAAPQRTAGARCEGLFCTKTKGCGRVREPEHPAAFHESQTRGRGAASGAHGSSDGSSASAASATEAEQASSKAAACTGIAVSVAVSVFRSIRSAPEEELHLRHLVSRTKATNGLLKRPSLRPPRRTIRLSASFREGISNTAGGSRTCESWS